jgi:putative NADH-flavin reductase
MQLVVLGASGGCGRHVVAHALARGHAVTAVVRPEAAYTAPTGATVARANVLDNGELARVVAGHDAIVSCLGIRRRFPRNPWSRMLSPSDLTSRAAAAIVAAMRAARLERVISISAAGVADSAPRMNRWLRWLFEHSRIGDAYRDLAVAESIFAASHLDWTCVRPVTLSPSRARPAREVDFYGLTAMIPRESVAIWMLDHLAGAVSRTPMIAA